MRSYAVAVVAVIGGLALLPASASGSALKRSPTSLYHALLTTPFTPTQVVGRFGGSSVARDTLSATNQKHHAIGAVTVTFAQGGGTITYTVFAKAADARNAWYEDTAAMTANGSFQARLRVTGLPSMSAFMYLGRVNGECPAPCTSTSDVLAGVTRIAVDVNVRSQQSNYDQADTASLTRAAYTHLLKLS